MTKIPHPPAIPILGNLHLIDIHSPVKSLINLSKKYDGIFKVIFPQESIIVLTSQAIVSEVCDETRFKKKIHLSLANLRPMIGDGLLTARTEDPNWQKANRILVPAFGHSSLKNLYAPMMDIAEQLILKWLRFGDGYEVDIADEMTKLTLDTIALTSFDYRFNSFYSEGQHPFVESMLRNLHEAGARASRPEGLNKILAMVSRQFSHDTQVMHNLADKIIRHRKENPDSEKKDLLNLMLTSKDPVTGEFLSDENIRFQLVTFLMAGHDTTSSLLSFVIYELLRNPDVLTKVRAEVDQTLQGRKPQFEDLPKFKYLDQVIKETLRLWPTASGFALQALQNTTLGGQYNITKNDTLIILLPSLHRDKNVWQDAEKFDPDRMRPELMRALPPHSWKPFGNGKRSCIGRGFAMQESILTLVMIMQKFDLFYADPNYSLEIRETLTVRPKNLRIKISLRKDCPRNTVC